MVATTCVEAFQQTKKYNTVLFSWYYKEFELLRRFLVNHPTDIDLEELDFEVVDKEMAIDKAAQASQAIQATVVALEGSTPELVETDRGKAAV